MNVLHTIAGVDPRAGGPSRSVPCLCRELAEVGVNTWLLSYSALSQEGVELGRGHLATGAGGAYVGARRDIRRLAAACHPDLMHIHALWVPGNHAASRHAKRVRCPVLLSPRGMLDPWALRQKQFKKRVAMWLYQRQDLCQAGWFHATSALEAASIRAQGLRQPIVVIPNGVDLPAAMPQRQDRAANKRTALFLSRLHPGKGLLDLVKAWDQVRPAGWLMRIVGPDVCGHRAVVEAEIARRGLKEAFEFAGEKSDEEKWQEYVNADLFIHPSHSENFGISVAEALAAGLPVITTKGTPWAELLGLSHDTTCGDSVVSMVRAKEACGRCGWWVDIGVASLAEALREAVLLSVAERRALGENGRKLVAVKYTWPAIAMQMKQAYEWILHGGERPKSVELAP